MAKNKYEILEEFINNHNLKPKQGTIEWLNERKSSIGGSSMAIITGINKYSNIKSLVKEKTNLKDFRGNKMTNWGNIFEKVTIMILEIIFECYIYETGSLPGCIENTSYSPDGLALIKKDKIISYINIDKISDDEDYIVLFEIKNPYSRIPDKTIPDIYVPQVKSGLCHINITDCALFVDCCIRKCSIDDINNINYNNIYHKDNIILTEPLWHGLLFVYKQFNNIFLDDNGLPLIDYGICDNELFNNTLLKIQDKELEILYFTPEQYNININIDNYIEKINNIKEKNNYTIYGFIPYKVYMLNIIPEYKDPTYVHQYKNIIDKVMKVINVINASSNKQEAFDKIFGQ